MVKEPAKAQDKDDEASGSDGFGDFDDWQDGANGEKDAKGDPKEEQNDDDDGFGDFDEWQGGENDDKDGQDDQKEGQNADFSNAFGNSDDEVAEPEQEKQEDAAP